MRTVKFYTLGCKVNQYDTQAIRERFIDAGFREPDNGLKAGVCVINTCTVTHKADQDSLNLIRRARRENPGARIIVTGCLAELDSKRIKRETGIGLFVKNKDKEKIINRLPGDIRKGLKAKTRTHAPGGITYFKGHTRAFLKIQDGCDNLCSYCRVPLARGRSCSKPLVQVMAESRELVKSGFKEIVLCGVCLGSYGKDLKAKGAATLVDAITALEGVEGLMRLRLSSIEAGDVSDGLIMKMAGSKKLCRHLHIPLQSGDNIILRKMNRGYSSSDYLGLIRRIRSAIPDISITTDCLVGFPGEKEVNFQNTAELIRQIQPLRTHIFPFSPREGTVASVFSCCLAPQLIKRRIEFLKGIAELSSLKYKERFLNKKMQVLFERKVKESTGLWEGYMDNYIKVRVKSKRPLANQIVCVRLARIAAGHIEADFC